MIFSKRSIIIFLSFAIIVSVAFWYFSKPESIKKPIAGENIIAFGDSLVEGVGANYGNDFVSHLSRRFGLSIINAGMSGDTTETALVRLEQDVLTQNPRIVIVLLGGNDAVGGVSKEKTFQNLEIIIDRVQGQGAAVILVGVRGGVFDKYRKSFEALAREKRIGYVSNILEGILGHSDLMSDQIHPNDKGYEIMADRIEPILRNILY